MRYVAFTHRGRTEPWPACPRRAPAADLKWQVSGGFNGVVRAGAWTPIFVTFTNDGGDRTGRVIANFSAIPGPGRSDACPMSPT